MKDCRAAGITAHIIPGIMPILGYDRFVKSVKYCQTNVPDEIWAELEPIKNDEEKVRDWGVQFCIRQCQDIIDRGGRFLHFYTMNLETSVIEAIKGLGIINNQKGLPFLSCSQVNKGRTKEDVRPIFWANKPQSYLCRTNKWEEFPNGRWGNSSSAAFDYEEEHYSFFKKYISTNKKDKLKAWGNTCRNIGDIAKVFVNFLNGKIHKFPFSEQAIEKETGDILDVLTIMNNNKMLTVNSQPKMNGISSDDPEYGWGPSHGFLYQKAYFEFLIHPSLIEALVMYLD